jgi:4-hydroxy-tetrahydrodipicolinate reductase
MTRTLIHGAGRMARRVLTLLPGFEGFELVGVVSRTRPDAALSVDWFSSLNDVSTPVDLLIDFTLPGGTRVASSWCAANQVALLSGTTGLADADVSALKDAGLEVPVLWAPNLSRGIALITALVRQASDALGADAEVSINDIHHRHKLDAPSGTALALGAAVKAGQAENLSDTVQGEPAYSSVREGEVIGEHTVSFTTPGEVIEICHKALDRDVFARGALKAGDWLVKQAPGYYSSSDWLGLD